MPPKPATSPTIHETSIREFSGLKCRIQVRQVAGVWQQRHIWYPAPATYVEEITADNWIRGSQVLGHKTADGPLTVASKSDPDYAVRCSEGTFDHIDFPGA